MNIIFSPESAMLLGLKIKYMMPPPQENLFLNTLSFEFSQEPVTFYFSIEDRIDCCLTKLNHALSPQNIKDTFPNKINGDTLYTSFDREIDQGKRTKIKKSIYRDIPSHMQPLAFVSSN
jgi:hypothetical protein